MSFRVSPLFGSLLPLGSQPPFSFFNPGFLSNDGRPDHLTILVGEAGPQRGRTFLGVVELLGPVSPAMSPLPVAILIGSVGLFYVTCNKTKQATTLPIALDSHSDCAKVRIAKPT